MFYEILKTSYGGTGRSWCCNKVSAKEIEYVIQKASHRLEDVAIENKDFRNLIRQYDRPNTVFYLDPPYYTTEDMYDNVGSFGVQAHMDLHDLACLMQGRCLISYNGCDFIRQLYHEENFSKYEFVRPHSLKQRYEKGAMFPEILIANYDMEKYTNPSKQLTLLNYYDETR